MKGRMQKISNDNLQVKDRSETESELGVQTYMGITENNFTTIEQADFGLLEQILSPTNLNKAYKQVKSNKGSGGVDGLGVEDLLDYLRYHKDELLQSIIRGKYKPNPVRRVEIPKEGGKKRQLGIPTVVDRVIQQAIAQSRPIGNLRFTSHFSQITVMGFVPNVVLTMHRSNARII